MRPLLRDAEHAGLRQAGAAILVALAIWMLWPAAHGGRLGLVGVSGNSMRPTYAPGEVLLSWPGEVRVGQPVLLRVPEEQPMAGTIVIHRIHDRDAGGWITKGDNSTTVDGWRLQDADVLGRVVVRLPGVGQLLAGVRHPIGLGIIAATLCLSSLWPSGWDPRAARGRRLVRLEASCTCTKSCTAPGTALLPAGERGLIDALRTARQAAPPGEGSRREPPETEHDAGYDAGPDTGRIRRQRDEALLRAVRRQGLEDRSRVLGRSLRTLLRRLTGTWTAVCGAVVPSSRRDGPRERLG